MRTTLHTTSEEDVSGPAAERHAPQIALTVKQVAAMFGMTPKAVYHRADRGQLPGKFYVGKSLRFRPGAPSGPRSKRSSGVRSTRPLFSAGRRHDLAEGCQL